VDLNEFRWGEGGGWGGGGTLMNRYELRYYSVNATIQNVTHKSWFINTWQNTQYVLYTVITYFM
jgi:hypothetical protein